MRKKKQEKEVSQQETEEIKKVEYMLTKANPPLRTIQRSYLIGYLESLKGKNKDKETNK